MNGQKRLFSSNWSGFVHTCQSYGTQWMMCHSREIRSWMKRTKERNWRSKDTRIVEFAAAHVYITWYHHQFTWKCLALFCTPFLLLVIGEFLFLLMNDEHHDEIWRIITQHQKAYVQMLFFGHKQTPPPTIYFSFRFLKQFDGILWVKIRAYSVIQWKTLNCNWRNNRK